MEMFPEKIPIYPGVIYKEESIEEKTQEIAPMQAEPIKLDKQDVLVRRRLPPKDMFDQAAFAKASILIITSIFAALFLSMVILVLK